MDPEIREFAREDIGRLYEIDQQCFPEGIAYSRRELLWFILQPGAVTRIAHTAGQIAGFAVGQMKTRLLGHIITLDVVGEARRRGIGTLLMESLHEEFRSHGLVVATLEVAAANSVAKHFYSRLQYRCVETLQGYYGDGSDADRMIREL